MMNKKLDVLLVDDHTVVRAGFRMLLSAQSFVNKIIDIDRGEQALHAYAEHTPDVVVMDLSMPGIGGLETIRRLTRQDPKAVVLVYSIDRLTRSPKDFYQLIEFFEPIKPPPVEGISTV